MGVWQRAAPKDKLGAWNNVETEKENVKKEADAFRRWAQNPASGADPGSLDPATELQAIRDNPMSSWV